MKQLVFLLSLIIHTANAQWYYGSGEATNLENSIGFDKHTQKIISGSTVNPSSTSTSGGAGSLLLKTDGNAYLKKDSGSTTNWDKIVSNLNDITSLTGNIVGNASFAGAITVPSIVDNGSGNITVNALDVAIFDNATQGGTAKKYSLSSLTTTLTDGVMNYIVASYNAGTPILKVITDVSQINESSVVPIYSVFRSGSTLHITSWDSLGNGLANKIHQSIVKTQRYRRESGLALGESGAMNVTVSSGIVWTGANPVSLLSVNSLTDNLIYFQRTGTSSWSPIIQSVYNNLEYFNGTTTVTLTNNRYAVNWVYRGIESQKHIYIVSGEGDYSLPQAQASQPPANLPPQITSHALLVGRIIVLKGAVVATQIDSAFSLTFAGSGVTDHNSLLNLQGGTTGEYYHLTSAQNTAVGTLSSTTTNYVLKRSATGFVNSVIFDDGNYVGIGSVSPAVRLEVNGNTGYGFPATTGTTTVGVSIRTRSAGSVSVLDIGGNLTSGSWLQTNNYLDLSVHYPLMLNPIGGNVGIGNTAPTTALDVTGDVTTSGYVYFGNSTTDGSFRMTVSGGALVVQKRISSVWTQVASFDEN